MSPAMSTNEWMPSATRACEKHVKPTTSFNPAKNTLTVRLIATVKVPFRWRSSFISGRYWRG